VGAIGSFERETLPLRAPAPRWLLIPVCFATYLSFGLFASVVDAQPWLRDADPLCDTLAGKITPLMILSLVVTICAAPALIVPRDPGEVAPALRYRPMGARLPISLAARIFGLTLLAVAILIVVLEGYERGLRCDRPWSPAPGTIEGTLWCLWVGTWVLQRHAVGARRGRAALTALILIPVLAAFSGPMIVD
jgi:hypothetical protein